MEGIMIRCKKNECCVYHACMTDTGGYKSLQGFVQRPQPPLFHASVKTGGVE